MRVVTSDDDDQQPLQPLQPNKRKRHTLIANASKSSSQNDPTTDSSSRLTRGMEKAEKFRIYMKNRVQKRLQQLNNSVLGSSKRSQTKNFCKRRPSYSEILKNQPKIILERINDEHSDKQPFSPNQTKDTHERSAVDCTSVKQRSTLYIVTAQPLKLKASPFILQIFVTDNKFDKDDVSKPVFLIA